MSSQVTGITPEEGSSGDFGANEWLVDEMYEQFKRDRNSVDRTWWPILENYQQTKGDINGSLPDDVGSGAQTGSAATTPAQPAASAPAAPQSAPAPAPAQAAPAQPSTLR